VDTGRWIRRNRRTRGERDKKDMRVHFTGIKGVGMAALALAYQDAGWEVTGSDTKEKQITDEPLKNRGIKVFEKFTPRNIWKLKKMVWVPAIDKLIYTGAHHGAQNVEVKWAASRGVPVANYARAAGEFFADKKQICVCGVGGKTTTAAMIATILYFNKLDPSWIVGTSEIASLPAAGKYGKGEWAVIEGDEYVADPAADKTPKFMYLNPKIVVCTNISYDHPDVYKSEEDVSAAYIKLFKKTLKNGGKVLLSEQAAKMIGGKAPYQTYFAPEASGLALAKGVGTGFGRTNEFSLTGKFGSVRKGLEETSKLMDKIRKIIRVPGEYNVRNALAAAAAAKKVGVSEKDILAGLAQYRGAKRRFEFIGESGGIGLYDDYAHHPAEIRVLAVAAKEKFPGKKIIFVFQPHTFSRTKALFSEFADSLKLADEVVMYPIFGSAREEKDETVSSQMLAEEIKRRGGRAVSVMTEGKLVEYLARTAKPDEVIFTVGAGNLYEAHQDILAGLEKKRAAV